MERSHPRGTVRSLSVAPMMERTHRYHRHLMRQLTRRTLLYTEMVTTGAILQGRGAELLVHDPLERPLALQLGGDDPAELRACARLAEDLGYDEVNLNVGCPSSRVQSGRFGVCLMGRPERVAECVAEMRAEVVLPVTVKHRIGFDDLDAYEDMLNFVDVVAAAGADRFTVHARKAWLQGLSPKENRNIPPLRYEEVARLKAERPSLVVELNGGITDLEAACSWLGRVDAVMIGRAAWDEPWIFVEADARVFGDAPREAPTRADVARHMGAWLTREAEQGGRSGLMLSPLMGLFTGVPGARAWRRALSEGARRDLRMDELVERALAAQQAAARSPRVQPGGVSAGA